MATIQQFTVRPLPKATNTELKDAYRILLSSTSLLLQKLEAGDPCRLFKENVYLGIAIAWPAPEKIQDYVVQSSKSLQKAYGLSLGDKISISKCHDPIETLGTVFVRDVTTAPDQRLEEDVDDEHWEWYLEYPLGMCQVYPQTLQLTNQ